MVVAPFALSLPVHAATMGRPRRAWPEDPSATWPVIEGSRRLGEAPAPGLAEPLQGRKRGRTRDRVLARHEREVPRPGALRLREDRVQGGHGVAEGARRVLARQIDAQEERREGIARAMARHAPPRRPSEPR